jgi:hypothetical protein
MQPRSYVDVNTGLDSFYCPEGPYLHIPPLGPNSAFDAISFDLPYLNIN